jgi:hypothetical protein
MAIFQAIAYLGAFSAIYLMLARPSYIPITQFPEIWRGHTAVHQQEHGFPIKPAYMVWLERQFVFYDLFTYRSIGDLHAYTKCFTIRCAYRTVHLTPPIYGRRSLHEYFMRPHFIQHKGPLHPTIQALLDRRKQFWWPVAVQQHKDMVDQIYGSFVHTLYDTRLNVTLNYTQLM